MRSLGRTIGEGLMWMGYAWNGLHPPLSEGDYDMHLAEQPCWPPLSEKELAEWTALVRNA